MPRAPKKLTPITEQALLKDLWANLVETDPVLARTLGRARLQVRLKRYVLRLLECMATVHGAEGVLYF